RSGKRPCRRSTRLTDGVSRTGSHPGLAKSLRFRDRGGSAGRHARKRALVEAEPAMTDTLTAPDSLGTTPLHALHVARGGRMVVFAGYSLPLHYGDGIVADHAHVRRAAGLFDVSHMGQAFLAGPDHDTLAAALETVAPAELIGLPRGRMRYTQLLDDSGGI